MGQSTSAHLIRTAVATEEELEFRVSKDRLSRYSTTVLRQLTTVPKTCGGLD